MQIFQLLKINGVGSEEKIYPLQESKDWIDLERSRDVLLTRCLGVFGPGSMTLERYAVRPKLPIVRIPLEASCVI